MRVWDPPRRVVFGWRQAKLAPDQSTEVAVRFEPVDTGTLVTVEHFGWDTLPRSAPGAPRLPPRRVPARHAEWWQGLLRSLGDHVTA